MSRRLSCISDAYLGTVCQKRTLCMWAREREYGAYRICAKAYKLVYGRSFGLSLPLRSYLHVVYIREARALVRLRL